MPSNDCLEGANFPVGKQKCWKKFHASLYQKDVQGFTYPGEQGSCMMLFTCKKIFAGWIRAADGGSDETLFCVQRNCLECLDIVAESDHVMSSLGTRCGYLVMGSKFIITIIIINPLTARVVGAPQMILQPVLLNFSLFSTALWDSLNSRPVHSLMLSSHLVLPIQGNRDLA